MGSEARTCGCRFDAEVQMVACPLHGSSGSAASVRDWSTAEAEVEQLRALLRQVREVCEGPHATVKWDVRNLIDESGLLGGSDG